MMRTVEYSRDATRILNRIDRKSAEPIRAKVEQLASDPDALANNVKAVKGEPALLRLRVGDWRVLYTEQLIVLLVVRIAPRGGAYD